MIENPEKPDGGKAPRLAIYLSALVFPGAGQFFQKRWLAGLFYAVFFSVGVVFLFISILTPLCRNLRIMLASAGMTKEPVLFPAPVKEILLWSALALLVYLLSLRDIMVYNRRKSSK